MIRSTLCSDVWPVDDSQWAPSRTLNMLMSLSVYLMSGVGETLLVILKWFLFIKHVEVLTQWHNALRSKRGTRRSTNHHKIDVWSRSCRLPREQPKIWTIRGSNCWFAHWMRSKVALTMKGYSPLMACSPLTILVGSQLNCLQRTVLSPLLFFLHRVLLTLDFWLPSNKQAWALGPGLAWDLWLAPTLSAIALSWGQQVP